MEEASLAHRLTDHGPTTLMHSTRSRGGCSGTRLRTSSNSGLEAGHRRGLIVDVLDSDSFGVEERHGRCMVDLLLFGWLCVVDLVLFGWLCVCVKIFFE